MNYKKILFLGTILLNLNLINCMERNIINKIQEEKKTFNLGTLNVLPDEIKKEILNYYICYIYDKYNVTSLLAISKDFNRFIKTHFKKEFKEIYKELNCYLMLECCFGKTEKIESLIKSGANVNHQTANSGDTPLMIASGHQHLEIVKLLIKKGANNFNLKNNTGQTALTRACFNKEIEIVKLLIDSGADVDLRLHGILPINCTTDKQIKKIIQKKMGEIENIKEKKRKLEEFEDDKNDNGYNCNLM